MQLLAERVLEIFVVFAFLSELAEHLVEDHLDLGSLLAVLEKLLLLHPHLVEVLLFVELGLGLLLPRVHVDHFAGTDLLEGLGEFTFLLGVAGTLYELGVEGGGERVLRRQLPLLDFVDVELEVLTEVLCATVPKLLSGVVVAEVLDDSHLLHGVVAPFGSGLLVLVLGVLLDLAFELVGVLDGVQLKFHFSG